MFTYVLNRGFQNRSYGEWEWERIVNKMYYVNIIMRILSLEGDLAHPVFCYAISSRSLPEFPAL